MEPDTDSVSHRALHGFTNDWINAQPNSLSFLKFRCMSGAHTAGKISGLIFYLNTVHMRILRITCKASASICVWPQKDGRWQIGPKLRKVPLEWHLTKGQMSPQHLLQARAALLCISSVMQTCCHRLLWQQLKKRCPRSERRREQWGLLGRDDRKVNNSIGLTAEIIPLLSCSYMIPLKHLIFAQLLICAPLFMSALFTFPAAQFTCCCWDYPTLQDSRFLLLKQLLCCLFWPQSKLHKRVVEYLLSYLLILYVWALAETVTFDSCKSHFVLSVYLTGSCQVKEQTVSILCPACATVDLLLAAQLECVWIEHPRAQR